MAKYVDFPLEDGENVRVEVLGDDGTVRRGEPKDVIEPTTLAFEAAMAKLKPICTTIVKQAKELVEQPEEFSVEFGVKLNAEAGMVIAKAAAKANLKISVKWKKAEKQKDGRSPTDRPPNRVGNRRRWATGSSPTPCSSA